ncbi:MAG: DUF1800 domain-containing protein [Bacteroidota bacterium]
MLNRRSFLRGPRAAPPRRSPLAAFVPTGADPWNAAKARHLLRRVTIGARPDDVDALLTLTPTEAVDRIVDRAVSRPALPEPSWAGLRRPDWRAPDAEKQAFRDANNAARDEQRHGALNRLLGSNLSGRYARLGEAFRERMTVFWSNHYVADYQTHNLATWLWRYRKTLRAHAFGNVRDAVHEVGTTPAMLAYLNGNDSRAGQPNENYARELLELFTMGIDGPDGSPNYTQADITELSRALTGWRTNPREATDVYFDADRFDDGEKTIFGRTGPFGYDDIVPLVFDERAPQIARFIARKLYVEFVAEDPDENVVADLAQALLDVDFEVEPVVRVLLKSEHFFDAANQGALIKSPVELILGSAQAFGLREITPDRAGRYYWVPSELDQELFNPPDVKGWRTGRAWINTSTIAERDRRGSWEVWENRDYVDGTIPSRPEAVVARTLVDALSAELLAHSPSEAETDDLVELLLSGTPEYAWDPTTNGGKHRIRQFLLHLIGLPAYQLR